MIPGVEKHHSNPSVSLKRSMTVSVLPSPFQRRPVESLPEQRHGSVNLVKVTAIPSTTLLTKAGDEEKTFQTKEDASKMGTSKSGAFFGKNVLKKALTSLKIPGTRKTGKKDITIGPPTDFASLYQSRALTVNPERGQKTVSFLETGKEEEDESDCISTEPDTQEVEPDIGEIDATLTTAQNSTGEGEVQENSGGLSVIPLPVKQHAYYNLLIPPVAESSDVIQPKKPPRDFSSSLVIRGYLQPSLSQRTKEKEEELRLNMLPELGPLPTPPATSSPDIPDAPSSLSIPDPNVQTETNDKDQSITVESHEISKNTSDLPDDKVSKPQTKPKPDVPRRPDVLKLKPKVLCKPTEKVKDRPRPIPRSLTLDSASVQKRKESGNRTEERRRSAPLEETALRSRSCEFLDLSDHDDCYISNMHALVLKDIQRSWQNKLRIPSINLAGACWEDFEIVEAESWRKMSEDQCSVSLLVRLTKASRKLDTSNGVGQFIAKIKCETEANSSTKSLYDQDYSVCSSMDSHENVSRVLAYFRGHIQLPVLNSGNGMSPLHTTISITDQVPVQTCEELAAHSADIHAEDPYSYERTVCLLMIQCLKGLQHLHNSGFTHGNLNLNNLFLIKHANDFQLILGNFGKSQPLAKERRASTQSSKSDDSLKFGGLKQDLTAASEAFSALLHHDQNGNQTHSSKSDDLGLSRYLRKASERLRDGTASSPEVVRFLQALLWGPFRLDEKIVILSESRLKHWLEKQRGELIARLALDEALARTRAGHSRKFSMEDLMLCDYLTVATPESLAHTEKRWFLDI